MKQKNTVDTRYWRIMTFIFLGIMLLFLLSSQVAAFGVAPSSYSLNHDRNSYDLKLRVVNSQQEDLFIKIEPRGELAKYVELDEDKFFLSHNESSKTVHYTLTLPDDLSPGENNLDIVVEQLPDENSDDYSTIVSASVSIIQKVVVHVPYPGKYLTGKLFVESTGVNKPIVFTSHVTNKGQDDLLVSGKIIIYGPTNEIIDELLISPSSVATISDQKLIATDAGLQHPGTYYAESVLNYGGEQLVLRKTFVVGEALVEAKNIVVDKFSLGDIAKLTIYLENKWNQKIDDLYVVVKMLDKNGNTVSSFKTTSIALDSSALGQVQGFWETEGLSPGEYDLAVNLYYKDKMTQQFFKAVVGVDSLHIISPGVSGQVIGQPDYVPDSQKGSRTTNLLIVLVIVLIAINFGWLLLMKRKNKK